MKNTMFALAVVLVVGLPCVARGESGGMIVLQTGSDWCESGEDVRKVFESPAFRRALVRRGGYDLAVYDDMERPTPKVAAANKALEKSFVRSSRFPAISFISPQPRRFFALIENIPYDITYFPKYGFTSIPSFSLEYYPSNYGHWTFGADLEIPMWQHWNEHRFLQIQNLTLNTRYYFKRGNYHGLYVLGNVNGARYGLGWDAKGWEGEGFGISVGVGYKLTLYKRLFLDAGIAVGYFYSRYDPYEYGFDSTQRYYYDYVGLAEDFVRRNHALNWIGPTRVWISIGIELFSRKREK